MHACMHCVRACVREGGIGVSDCFELRETCAFPSLLHMPACLAPMAFGVSALPPFVQILAVARGLGTFFSGVRGCLRATPKKSVPLQRHWHSKWAERCISPVL